MTLVIAKILAIIFLLLSILRTLVIIQFVMSLLINFNVINTYNEFVAGIWRALNTLLDPFYRPLRRILPDTRPIDFAPMAFLILISII